MDQGGWGLIQPQFRFDQKMQKVSSLTSSFYAHEIFIHHFHWVWNTTLNAKIKCLGYAQKSNLIDFQSKDIGSYFCFIIIGKNKDCIHISKKIKIHWNLNGFETFQSDSENDWNHFAKDQRPKPHPLTCEFLIIVTKKQKWEWKKFHFKLKNSSDRDNYKKCPLTEVSNKRCQKNLKLNHHNHFAIIVDRKMYE